MDLLGFNACLMGNAAVFHATGCSWTIGSHNFDGINDYIEQLDVVLLAEWFACKVSHLEENVARIERLFPDKPIVLGEFVLMTYDAGVLQEFGAIDFSLIDDMVGRIVAAHVSDRARRDDGVDDAEITRADPRSPLGQPPQRPHDGQPEQVGTQPQTRQQGDNERQCQFLQAGDPGNLGPGQFDGQGQAVNELDQLTDRLGVLVAELKALSEAKWAEIRRNSRPIGDLKKTKPGS